MRESRIITALRHSVLLLFVAIALYPALNVVSISLRPDNRLQSTDLAIIPENWTLQSYIQLFTEQPFLRWLANSMIVAAGVTVTGVVLAAVGGYAFSRFRFVGRNTTMLAILSRHDATAAAVYTDCEAAID
jgi:arabinogalactan oligomer/maltooligosaccharide transport system permease protein